MLIFGKNATHERRSRGAFPKVLEENMTERILVVREKVRSKRKGKRLESKGTVKKAISLLHGRLPRQRSL